MPENGPAKELQSEYPNVVWRSNYVGNKTEEPINYNEETGLVNVARNLIFDEIISKFDKGEYHFAFSQSDRMFEEFIDHWATMSKIAEFDRAGNPTFAWKAPENAWDHFAHSFLYYHIARHRLDMITPKFGIAKADDGEEIRRLVERQKEDFFKKHYNENHWLDL